MATNQQEAGKIDQLQHVSPDEMEHALGRERENLEGWIPELVTDEEVQEALEKAFDYRGDVTITRKGGSVDEGYLFDRRTGQTLSDSVVRLMLTAGNEKVSIPYSDVARVVFSGRDTAAGKSFDAWVKKYWEKKAAGEKNIGIAAEKLD